MLVRWNRQGVILKPNDFIPLLEKTLLINDLLIYSVKEAINTIKHFKEKYIDVSLSINISPKNLMSNKCVDTLINTILNSGLNTKHFEFEITEGMIINFCTKNINNLNKIRNAKIKLSIDDFGTGYSSLSYLHDMVVDYIKIDKVLLKNTTNSIAGKKLYKNLVTFLNSLNFKIVCEGVETLEQLNLINALDVDYYQGYFISKSLDLTKVDEWIIENINMLLK